MELSQQQILAMKRKRGELNLTLIELERQTGVSRWTLRSIIKQGHVHVNSSTFKHINDWIIDEYTGKEM